MPQSENHEEDDHLDDLERDKKVTFTCLIKAEVNGDPFDLVTPKKSRASNSILFDPKRCKIKEIEVTNLKYKDWK